MNQLGDESSWSFRNADSGEWQPYPRDAQIAMDDALRRGIESIALSFPGDRDRNRLTLIDFRRMTQINESSGMQCQIRQSPGIYAPTEPWVCPQCTMINPETNCSCQACHASFSPAVSLLGGNSSSDDDEDFSYENDAKEKDTSRNNASDVGMPWIFDLYKSLCIVTGKFSTSLISGPKLEQDELELTPWLRCNLFEN